MVMPPPRTEATPDRRLAEDETPRLGARLLSPRGLYWHHGIYVGAGQVIHYAGFHRNFLRGPVERVSLDEFARGRGIWVRATPEGVCEHDVVRRAHARLGERRYRLLTNNCRHFCDWCESSEPRSPSQRRVEESDLGYGF